MQGRVLKCLQWDSQLMDLTLKKGQLVGSLEKENKFLSTNSFHWRMLLPWEPTSSILFFPFKCLNSLNIKKLALQQALCYYRSSPHSTDILERRGFLQAQGLSTIKWELPDLGHFLGVSQTTEMWSATTPPRFGITEGSALCEIRVL